MLWMPEEDADALVESAMVAVRLDGADIRCPWEVARLFNIEVKALVDGPTHGQFDLSRCLARVRFHRCDAVTRWRLAHELGHLVLCLSGLAMPHDEALASRCGRALCLSRAYVLRGLEYMGRAELVAHHSEWLPETVLDLRIWEVQQDALLRVG